MKLTYDQRQALIGKSFVSNMNHPVESTPTTYTMLNVVGVDTLSNSPDTISGEDLFIVVYNGS